MNGQLSLDMLDNLNTRQRSNYNLPNSGFWGWLSMESQPQNREFRNNPKNFHPAESMSLWDNFKLVVTNKHLPHYPGIQSTWTQGVSKGTCTLCTHSKQPPPRSAVGNVSGYRCVSDCRSRGREFDPGPVPYFRGDWSWNDFYGHSPPFRWFIQEGLLSVTSKSMCTNFWLIACSSLPRKKCG